MSHRQPIHKKPKGLYRASSYEYSCDFCAYFTKPNCQLTSERVEKHWLMKCAHWLNDGGWGAD